LSEPERKSRGFFGRVLGGRREEPKAEPREQIESGIAQDESLGSSLAGGSAAAGADTGELATDIAQESTASSGEPSEPAPLSSGAGATSPPAKSGWLSRLTSGLSKTSSRISDGISGLFTKQKLDDATLEDLEDLLLQADLGIETASRITERISKSRYEKEIAPEEVRKILAEEVERVLRPVAKRLKIDEANKPHVILMLGVNGTGKTTTIGKLAAQFAGEGKRVMIAAGDTFRAAAIEQLKVWGERTGATVIAREAGADAAGVAFDALNKAKSERYDVLLIDTAGRLQNKQALMEQLEKIVRVLGKFETGAPHECVLVLDATTGQNAMQQVEVFRERAGVTGLVMTKLDGTARGGILVSIAARHQIPVFAIGVGEGIEDLQPFDADDFSKAIANG
jgi:fused signal recognition particle receptor